MKDISIAITGADLDFDLARDMSRVIAQRDNGETDCLAWFDGPRNSHSPASVQCEIKGSPGWEVYGENHGGRLKIIINQGEYVFIHS